MTTTATPRRALTRGEVEHLGADLIRTLAPHVGDPDEVDAALLAWLDQHDVPDLGLVHLAALRQVFADCLTPAPTDEAPPGAALFHHDAAPTNTEETDR